MDAEPRGILYLQSFLGSTINNRASREHASRTLPREVFLTTELTIDGLGANGDSAYESVKEHIIQFFSGLKRLNTAINQ